MSVKLTEVGQILLQLAFVSQIDESCSPIYFWKKSIIIAVDCGPLSDPDNGAVTTDPDTTLNSVATYRCRRGFKLIGEKKRTCETSGEWSGEAPTCESKQIFR